MTSIDTTSAGSSDFEHVHLEDVNKAAASSAAAAPSAKSTQPQPPTPPPRDTTNPAEAPADKTTSSQSPAQPATAPSTSARPRPWPVAATANDAVTVDLAVFGIDELGIASTYMPGDASAIDGLAKTAIKDLEDVGHKVASLARTAANDVTKLWQHPETATAGLADLSSGLSNWFTSTLAPATGASPSTKETTEEAPVTTKPSRSLSSLQSFFQLPVEENILESFTCSVQQTVDCNHNNYTRGLVLTMPGILCITDVHVCFVGDDAAAVPPFKLPHKDIVRVSSPKCKPAKKNGTGKRMLRLDVGDDDKSRSHVVFVEFHGQQLDDALALIELKQEA